MRIVLLSVILLSTLYLLRPGTEPDVEEIDDVKLRLSSAQQIRPAARPQALVHREEILPEPEAQDNASAADVSDAEIASVSTDEEIEEPVEEAPESAQEKGWQDELSQALMTLEPEQGEEMYNAYVNERNTYQATLDDTIRSNQKNQDLEGLIAELENKHEERVKEIFGARYEDVKELEAKYLESESH